MAATNPRKKSNAHNLQKSAPNATGNGAPCVRIGAPLVRHASLTVHENQPLSTKNKDKNIPKGMRFRFRFPFHLPFTGQRAADS